MSVLSQDAKRCVLWFGAPDTAETNALTLHGWQLRAIPPGSPAAFGLRGDDRLAAVVELAAHTPEDLHALWPLLDEHHHLPVLLLGERSGLKALGVPEQMVRRARLSPRLMPAIVEALSRLDGSAPATDSPLARLLGSSAAMHRLHAQIRKYAPVELPVLITGETGTGKEMAAHALHLLSSRASAPFRAINCGAIPATLVQSELFGHERGAFTGAHVRRQGMFEAAEGGTVFLDEIGDLPLEAQTSLLRVLQEGTVDRVGSNQSVAVDVRVIAATHVDLEKAVQEGRFRQDLYYRLNVLRLSVPALRERAGDVLQLASHFLEDFRSRHCIRARGFTCAARAAMEHFDWPGNVRELLNRVQRAAITAETELVTAADLDLPAPPATPFLPPGEQRNADRHRIERDTLLSCLQKTRYNISACARLMQVSRVTVYRLCRKHQLAPPGAVR